MIKKVKNCRICGGASFTIFLSFGDIPLPNAFLKPEELKKREPRFPLTTCICDSCGLVQLYEIVDPEVMFRNYVYIPSSSKTRMKNFSEIAQQAIERQKLNQDSLVIDIGSNDGSLLSFFKGIGIKTLGIDPATNLAKIAELKGIETINDYVSTKLAKKIRKMRGPAKVVTATNVVAHIDDLVSLLSAVEILLDEDGIFICEFPYLLDLIQNNQFDTIYHEHLSYFSIKPILKLLQRVKLHFVDIVRTPIDGGSLRIFLGKKKNPGLTKKIERMISEEENYSLYDLKTLKAFANRVKDMRLELRKKLKEIKKQKKTIAAYGAAAKGNILLNYCDISTSLIKFAVDSTPYKQGLYTPGSHIPIYPESEIVKRNPDYVIILAWNFAAEIMKKERKYSAAGGKFIIPVPRVTII